MPVPKAHHLVPKEYLRGFTTISHPEQIWVYEKNGRPPYLTNIRNAAVETHFYSIPDANGEMDTTLETQLNLEVEIPANPIIAKIRTRQPITPDEKVALAGYMSVLLKRGNKTRERLVRSAPEVADKVAAAQNQTIDELIAQDSVARAADGERIRQAIHEIIDDFRANPSKAALLAPVNTSLSGWLSAMSWQFLTFDRGVPFLTSDSPLIYPEALGLRNMDTELIWPISTTVALWAMWGENIPQGYITATEQVVREINYRTVRSAYRCVYSPVQAFWIRNMIATFASRPARPYHWIKVRQGRKTK